MLYGNLIIACQLKIQASTVSSITMTVTRQVIIRKDCDAAGNLPTIAPTKCACSIETSAPRGKYIEYKPV